MLVKEIFERYKTIAVVGMSKNPAKASYSVPKFFIDNGYKVIPVNPTADEIDGIKVYKTLSDIPDIIEILNVFRPSDIALEVVQEAIERRKTKGDIKLIWLQEGIINDEAKKLAEDNGIEFIQDKCMYKLYESTH